MKHLLFTGGGSAGHTVPNLAIMNELRYAYRITYMGTGGIEKNLIEKEGYPFLQVDTPKLARTFTLKHFCIPFQLRKAVRQALLLMQKDPPDLVFSKGGYASFPAVWAAHKLKIPILTHESDLTPGLCTKLIAKWCDSVLTSFPETAKKFTNGVCVGSPIRKELFYGERSRARRKYSFGDKKPVLLVSGGGSGSTALNTFVQNNLQALTEHFYLLHLCGEKNAITSSCSDYRPLAYERDMASAYAAADVVLTRAGSNTVFELIALRKPAVFVPLEKHSRGDQLLNAQYFQKKLLCDIVRERQLYESPEEVISLLLRTASDEKLHLALLHAENTSGTPKIIQTIKRTLERYGTRS